MRPPGRLTTSVFVMMAVVGVWLPWCAGTMDAEARQCCREEKEYGRPAARNLGATMPCFRWHRLLRGSEGRGGCYDVSGAAGR